MLPTYLAFSLTLGLVLEPPAPTWRSAACHELTYYAQDAYDYARKAYTADDFDEALTYAKRAVSAALDAATAASACECADGQRYASDAYTYARRAYRAESLADVQYYAKNAMRAAEDTLAAASDCDE